jgi:hypothetical protein
LPENGGGKTALAYKWMKGVTKKVSKKNKKTFTYYFFDEPVSINPPLQKDGGIKKGRGKRWIAAAVPPNRCVTFNEFAKRMSVKNRRM